MARQRRSSGMERSWSDPDSSPPLPQAIPLGIQHVLAMFLGNITVPIIIANVLGSSPTERIFLIQAAMLVAGLATLIQTIGIGPVGARLPIVQGTSFGYLPLTIPLASQFGLGAVLGAAFIGGLVQMVLGAVLPAIRRFFPPLVSGLVVLTIGLSLIPVGMEYVAGGRGAPDFGSLSNLGLGLFVFLLALGIHQYTRGFWSASAVILAVIGGYLVAIPLGKVNFEAVGSVPWFALPQPLYFGFSFPIAAVVGMVIMAVITTVETIGDIEGITTGGANRNATNSEVSGGILADGLGTAIASLLNAMPNTSYSQNVGLVAMTRMMSRYVVAYGAVLLLIAGLFPKFGAIIASMPNPVLGGATVIMFGFIAVTGMKLLMQAHLNARNSVIVAISLGVGLGIYLRPEITKSVFGPFALLLNSGLIPVAVLAILLNIILPPSRD